MLDFTPKRLKVILNSQVFRALLQHSRGGIFSTREAFSML